MSRALTPDGTISAATRERVQAAADRLGYQLSKTFLSAGVSPCP
ncbi:helix-turn-helix domain-containing protein [Streptomyces pseudovenezuelae]|nr:helix-turn-helix domain-containing protein [Streptomyces pseudovenezuelae]